jgi:hypothetical protein
MNIAIYNSLRSMLKAKAYVVPPPAKPVVSGSKKAGLTGPRL